MHLCGFGVDPHRIQVVVHLAALMEFYPADPDLLWRTNCGATEVITAACARVSTVNRLVYCSSTEAMGGVDPQSTPRDESALCKPNYLYGWYSAFGHTLSIVQVRAK